MGLFGAMTTSVAGLAAQAFALQNISGNIANSQTTAYKSNSTTFSDLVNGDSSNAATTLAGSVMAISSPTNTLQGAVNATGVATNMAINGEGFFQVQLKTGETDGSETFSGANVYTRAGDFTMDKQGYLVNSAGAALMAIPIDPATQNPVGDTAQLLQISTGYLKANQTTAITYAANLPATPTSGVLNPSSFTVNPTNTASAAQVTATAAYTPMTIGSGQTLSFSITDAASPSTPYNVTFNSSSGTGGNVSMAQALAAINSALSGSTITASANSNGAIVLTSSVTGTSSGVTVSPITTTGTGAGTLATDIGFTTTGQSATGTNPANYVEAQDNTTFQAQSLAGSSTTAYTSNGSAVNVQMRWAQISTSPATWNLFYQSNTAATGTTPMWTNTGTSAVFNSSGQLVSPANGKMTISNMTVDGSNLGNITMKFGTGGLTQYQSPNGNVDVSTLSQDGYASGSLTTVGVNSQGEVTASYTNGQQVAIALVPLYKFNGVDALTASTGGIYVPNNESGTPVKMASTDITGGSLEASNTDIASQFSNMIVTQQAYSANSKVITTANTMMQSVMDIIR